MTSLLKKELLVNKKLLIMMLIIGLAYAGLAFASEEGSALIMMMVILCGLFPITTINLDDMAKFDYVVLTLPYSKKQIVGEKYVLGIFSLMVGLLYAIAGLILTGEIYEINNAFSIILMLTAIPGAVMFYLSFIIPLIIKFGSEKSRLFTVAIILFPIVVVLLITKTNIIPEAELQLFIENLKNNIYILALVPVIGVIMMFISYRVTLRIYKNKEF